ncbi:hypothetical protein B0H11DRAFT_2312093 [Mycena galericulata]|nr:hypothetical protein B0H11DRAFT_2312093 [Mycena galericulata]
MHGHIRCIWLLQGMFHAQLHFFNGTGSGQELSEDRKKLRRERVVDNEHQRKFEIAHPRSRPMHCVQRVRRHRLCGPASADPGVGTVCRPLPTSVGIRFVPPHLGDLLKAQANYAENIFFQSRAKQCPQSPVAIWFACVGFDYPWASIWVYTMFEVTGIMSEAVEKMAWIRTDAGDRPCRRQVHRGRQGVDQWSADGDPERSDAEPGRERAEPSGETSPDSWNMPRRGRGKPKEAETYMASLLPAELNAVGCGLIAAVCVLRSGTMECEDAARTQSGSVLICVTGLPVSMAWHAQRRPVRSMDAVLACLRSLHRGSRDHASQDQLLYCAHGPSDRRADSPTFLFGPDKVANDQLALQRFEGLYPACRPQMSGLMKHCLCCYGAIAKRHTIYAPPRVVVPMCT